MVLRAEHDCCFDLIDRQVPASPDHIAVAPALEAGLNRGTAFRRGRAAGGLDLFEKLDAKPFFPEPVDALGGNVGIHNDVPGGRHRRARQPPGTCSEARNR